MKDLKKIKYLMILTLFLGLISCDDQFLELTPKVNELEANAYINEDDAFSAMVAVYDALSVQNWNFVPLQSDIFSDDLFCGGEPGGGMWQWQDQERSIISPDNGAASALWNRCYSGNYRANMFFDKEEGIAWKTSGLRERMHSEVLVLRAYFYWDLVRHFGWVPVIPTLIPNTEDYKNLTQSNPEVVYQFIISDLLTALPNLPDKANSSEKGRITKDVARILIARIYLYYQGFAIPVLKASVDLSFNDIVINEQYVKTMISEIISSKRYNLMPDYASLFDWVTTTNKEESIFEWIYTDKANSDDWGGWGVDGNLSTVFFGPRSPVGDSTISAGWSFGTISWSVEQEFEANDPRKEVSIYYADSNLSKYAKGYQNTTMFASKYMGRKAYAATGGGVGDLNWPVNYIDMRYAEVLLIAAELYLQDDNAKALGYLNEVRTRSMGLEAALSGTLTLDQIYHERRVEFVNEGQRKWDLLRRNLDYAKQYIDASWVVPSNITNKSEFIGRQFDKNTFGMLPIPASEITLANPGILKQYVPAFQ